VFDSFNVYGNLGNRVNGIGHILLQYSNIEYVMYLPIVWEIQLVGQFPYFFGMVNDSQNQGDNFWQFSKLKPL
jgi:hypothetical protein